jgi:hypothetical protein
MHAVNALQVDEDVTEASTLGFPVGRWPDDLAVMDGPMAGQYRRREAIIHCGELVGFVYIEVSDSTRTIKVFND